MIANTTTIAEKIRRIIAKAESTTSEAEAATFMAKAHELLEKHNLDLADIPREQADEIDSISVTRNAVHFPASMHFCVRLSFGLARYYGCYGVHTKVGNRHNISVAGRESARKTFEIMWPFVIKQVRKLARDMVAADPWLTKSRAETAIGNALTIRVYNMLAEEELKEAKRIESGSCALVPVEDNKAAAHAAFPGMGQYRGKRSVVTTREAQEAANKVSLNHQTTHRQNPQLR